MANIVRKFLLEYCDDKEHIEYDEYISGDKTKSGWVEKALRQREKLIMCLPECDCGSSINIFENGKCYCSNSHPGYKKILGIIQDLSD